MGAKIFLIRHLPYLSGSPAGLSDVFQGLAELTKGTKVRVNTIMPGPTWTEGVATYIEGFAKDKGISAEEARKNYHKVSCHRFVVWENSCVIVIRMSCCVALLRAREKTP